ncbi:hypothetical protein ARMGADRAFT_220435 [Armillaria gallica]|uniref:Uncharacterized protein n=1 Tax=Armillaria gallica TaxID=47427 RepID=A0A2H3EEV1_ARMGA|nr:hypothetical protein ARMGADRAFT_220435 [Armillaria gallica]
MKRKLRGNWKGNLCMVASLFIRPSSSSSQPQPYGYDIRMRCFLLHGSERRTPWRSYIRLMTDIMTMVQATNRTRRERDHGKAPRLGTVQEPSRRTRPESRPLILPECPYRRMVAWRSRLAKGS